MITEHAIPLGTNRFLQINGVQVIEKSKILCSFTIFEQQENNESPTLLFSTAINMNSTRVFNAFKSLLNELKISEQSITSAEIVLAIQNHPIYQSLVTNNVNLVTNQNPMIKTDTNETDMHLIDMQQIIIPDDILYMKTTNGEPVIQIYDDKTGKNRVYSLYDEIDVYAVFTILRHRFNVRTIPKCLREVIQEEFVMRCLTSNQIIERYLDIAHNEIENFTLIATRDDIIKITGDTIESVQNGWNGYWFPEHTRKIEPFIYSKENIEQSDQDRKSVV